MFPDILAIGKTVYVKDQVHELFIGLVVVEGDYRYTVVQLIPKWVDCIIHDDEVLQLPIGDDPQVLYVDALLGSYTMISVESVLDQRPIWVKVVQYYISVGFVTSCENDDLIVFISFLQAL